MTTRISKGSTNINDVAWREASETSATLCQPLVFALTGTRATRLTLGLVFGSRRPAVPVRAPLGVDQGFNGVLPGAGGDAVVRAREVRLGNLEVQNGLAQGLILGEDDLFRRIPVLGLQAGPLAGHVVEAEKGSAFSAIQQAITIFHRLWCSLQKKFPELLRCYGRVGVVWHGLASAGKVVPVLMPVVASCRGKTLTQKRLCLEARVGIGL